MVKKSTKPAKKNIKKAAKSKVSSKVISRTKTSKVKNTKPKTHLKVKKLKSVKIKTKTKKPAKIKAKTKIKAPKKPTVKSKAKIKSEPKIKKEIKKITNKPESEKTTPPVAKIAKTLEPKITPQKINGFKAGDYAFYPSHGVGKILDVETIEVSGQKFDLFIMYFDKERLTIKIPVTQIAKNGLRPLISKAQMEEVFDILRSGVKKMKGMWSRRAQEYESKINSGNIILLAEVLRDLTRDIEDGDRSYSERIIYETAINRLALEYSVIAKITFEEAKEKIISIAKNKLGSGDDSKSIEAKIDAKGDDFDDFEDEEEEEDDDEDDEDDDEDDDDDRPKKRGRKKKK